MSEERVAYAVDDLPGLPELYTTAEVDDKLARLGDVLRSQAVARRQALRTRLKTLELQYEAVQNERSAVCSELASIETVWGFERTKTPRAHE